MPSERGRGGVVTLLVLAALLIIGAALYILFFSDERDAQSTSSSTTTTQPSFPLSFMDDAGRKVEIKAPPARIASLTPAMTEILFSLGLGDRVVATDDLSDFPASAPNTAKIGTPATPDLATLANASPQVVLSSSDSPFAGVLSRHAALIVLKADDLQSTYEAIDRIGQIADRKSIATDLKRQLTARERHLRSEAELDDERSVYLELPSNTSTTDAKWAAGLLAAANAKSIFPGGQVALDAESGELIDRLRPEVIIVAVEGESAASLRRRPGWQRLLSRTETALFTADDIDPALLTSPGPRGVDGLERLVGIIHPPGEKG